MAARRRGLRRAGRPADTPSRAAALALLGAGGTVLDVGCGAAMPRSRSPSAAASSPASTSSATCSPRSRPARPPAGSPHRTLLGRWPDVAAEAGTADVVVSHHVLHNVVDLPPFVAALTAAARRGVVVEMLAQHPMAWLDPLWVRFHGLHRPPPATTDDAVAVLASSASTDGGPVGAQPLAPQRPGLGHPSAVPAAGAAPGGRRRARRPAAALARRGRR